MKERNAYNGLCLVIVRTMSGRSGPIKLTAQSDNLTSGELRIVSVR
jgi:hypothetical protein